MCVSISNWAYYGGRAGFLTGICALGVGGVLALGAGSLLLRGDVVFAVLAFLSSVAVLALGLMAFVETWRALQDSDRDPDRTSPHSVRAAIAIYLLVMIPLLFGTVGAGLQLAFQEPLPPLTRIVGQVEHLQPNDPRRGSPRVSLKLATHPHWLKWSCSFFCGPFEEMDRLGDRPWPMAEAEVYGREIVGLTVDGRRYLEPTEEWARRRRDTWAVFALMFGVAALGILLGGMWATQRLRRYRGPHPEKSEARALMRRHLFRARSER